MERTFIMVKPDGVRRGLVGEVIQRFERKGYALVQAEFLTLTREQAEIHYQEHKGKIFFEELIEFIISGPVMAMVWEGENIIPVSRMMIGKTKPIEAKPGTIRGDFSFSGSENIVHGSDSLESAVREIMNVFG